MLSRVILSLVLVNVGSIVVKGHIDLPVPNEALDQNLYEEVLNTEQCLEQISIIRNNTFLAMFCKYLLFLFMSTTVITYLNLLCYTSLNNGN